MKKVFQYYFFKFSALVFWSVLLVPLFFNMAFADLSAKHTEISSLSSYTEFKDLAFALKEKMQSGFGSYEDFLLLNTLKQAISDSDIIPDERTSLLNEVAGIKQLWPAAFFSRKKKNIATNGYDISGTGITGNLTIRGGFIRDIHLGEPDKKEYLFAMIGGMALSAYGLFLLCSCQGAATQSPKSPA